MRKLYYYIAISLDGFICRHDGDISDFSFQGDHVQDLLRDFPETIPTHLRSQLNIDAANRKFDTVLMGRRTYEVGSSQGIASPYEHLKQYLFSTTLKQSPSNGITLVRDNAVEVVRQLKQESGMGIWLCGGSELASTLIDEIDELILKVNPFLMGAGKTLFSSSFAKRTLQPIIRREYSSGFALAHYQIVCPHINETPKPGEGSR